MDPVTGILTIAGLGISLFGKAEQAHYEQEEYGAQQKIFQLQKQENDQRQLAMQISARRQSIESMRQTQQAQARGVAAGVNQGAMGRNSSGIAGGQAQVTGEGAFNLLGISQNLTIGANLFGLQGQVSDQQSLISQLQSKAGTAAGISSIGSALGQSAGPMGRLLGNFFQGGADGGYTSSANQYAGNYMPTGLTGRVSGPV